MRFSRTQRRPRRPYPALQYLSRSLAFCEDSGSASIVAQSITMASLRILALQSDCERMQLGGHQSARDCRIFLREFLAASSSGASKIAMPNVLSPDSDVRPARINWPDLVAS